MIQLPHGCYCSDFNVFPNNWEKAGANIEKAWRFEYYFHDPSFRDDPKYKYGKLVIVKGGMNRFKTLSERREAIKRLMAYELNLLKIEGYNPITRNRLPVISTESNMDENTSFLVALKIAMNRLKIEKHTLEDIRSVLRYVEKAAIQLNYTLLPIGEVKRKHIRILLDQCAQVKERWTANTFNQYRKYLSILFKELVELEAIEFNPVKEISKQKSTKTMRDVLRPIDKTLIKVALTRFAPEFYRFIQIFFHSGARISELLRLQGKDVDLKAQRYKCLIKKGKSIREVERTIKDIALPYWKEALQHCGKSDVIFSDGLLPGKKFIRPEQVTRRWKRSVKRDLKVQADFYSLKHLNTDETAATLGLADAAAHNGHTSTVITMKHYAVGEKERQHERLKKVGNKFA